MEDSKSTMSSSQQQHIQLTVSPASTSNAAGNTGDIGHPRPLSSTITTTKIVNNPTPHRLPEGENAAPLEVIGTTASDKLVIIMVGLPATGTFLIFVFWCCNLHENYNSI